jgi:hypothetical protein
MRLPVIELAETPFAAGATLGSAVQARAIAKIGALADAIVFLDFDGIEAATGSFLREAVLGFRDFCHRSARNLTVVIANPSALVTEELGDLLTRLRDAVLCSQLSPEARPATPFIVGLLEDTQRRTLAAVLETGAADAASLAGRHAGDPDKIGVTGWNNRLAALAAKGLLRESRHGRAKIYRPALEGLILGS